MRPTIGINLDVTADGWLRMGLPAAYPDAVVEAGGRPRLVPAIEDEQLLREEVDGVDAFLFMGGPDYPPSLYGEPPHAKTNPMHERRAAVDMLLAGLVLRRGIPVLGICGGCQLLNIAMGGKLVQHLDRAEAHAGGQRHEVELSSGSRLARIFGALRIAVNSYHHQAVDPAASGTGPCDHGPGRRRYGRGRRIDRPPVPGRRAVAPRAARRGSSLSDFQSLHRRGTESSVKRALAKETETC